MIIAQTQQENNIFFKKLKKDVLQELLIFPAFVFIIYVIVTERKGICNERIS